MELFQACCESPHLLNEILECIQDPIVVTDLKGRILFSSTLVDEVLGYKPNELAGNFLSKIFIPEDLDHLYPNLLMMAQKQAPYKLELMLLRKDGSRFLALMVLRTCSQTEQGDGIIVVSIHDNQKEKQLEKVYRESHYEDLIEIANGIAHEIRNPLMGIGGFVNRLFKSDKVIHDYDKYHEYIIENIKKIEDVVEKVESFATIPEPRILKTPVREVVDNVVLNFDSEIKRHHIDIVINVGEMTLVIDKDLVIAALSILVSNAIDALPNGGTITINGEADLVQAKLVISDTGPGISPDDMPHIFRPFFSTKKDRVGIDLAIAKRIMVSHGGSVDVSSDVGRGATFTLIFPLERRKSLRVSRLSQEENKGAS